MPGNLLDTNAVIALQRGEESLIDLVRGSGEWYVSATVLGELYYGAYRSGRVEQNVRVIDDFAQAVPVLTCDSGTAKIFGQVHQLLRQKGRPIPENDIWIAAVAIQHDLILVSRDEHFSEIDNLKRIDW